VGSDIDKQSSHIDNISIHYRGPESEYPKVQCVEVSGINE